MRRDQIVITGLGFVLAFLAPSTAAAKSGIVARLDAPLPRSALPGTELTIGWTLNTTLIGTATVLRIFPANGGGPVDTSAREDRPNHFVASVMVPPGGMTTIGIGIPGESCIGNVCAPAIEFFAVIDPSGAPIRSSPALHVPDTSTLLAIDTTSGGISSLVLLFILLASITLAFGAWPRRRA